MDREYSLSSRIDTSSPPTTQTERETGIGKMEPGSIFPSTLLGCMELGSTFPSTFLKGWNWALLFTVHLIGSRY